MAKDRVKINNSAKTIVLTNEVFENPTKEEKAKIDKYLAINYHYDIVDEEKRSTNLTQKFNDEYIGYALSKTASESLKLDDKKLAEVKSLYETLRKVSFPKAKSFFIELYKLECPNKDSNDFRNYIKKNPARHKDYEALMSFYVDYCKENNINWSRSGKASNNDK